MRWRGGRESTNVDDRRGMGAAGGTLVGGGIIGAIFLIIRMFMGNGDTTVDPSQILYPGGQGQEMTAEEQAADEERAKFVKVTLGYTEDVWTRLFQQNGGQYQTPTLVLYRGSVQSACGIGSSA